MLRGTVCVQVWGAKELAARLAAMQDLYAAAGGAEDSADDLESVGDPWGEDAPSEELLRSGGATSFAPSSGIEATEPAAQTPLRRCCGRELERDWDFCPCCGTSRGRGLASEGRLRVLA